MIVPLVSVVIPTYSRPRQLLHCLDAFCGQTMSPSEFELVVVDDGSPVPLDAIVASFQSRLNVRLLRQANAGPAAARNYGAKSSSARLIAFTDDDCQPLPNWLEVLVSAELKHPNALIGGTTLNGLSSDIFATTSQMIVDLVYEHFNAELDDAYFFASNNILCTRERLLALGGFDIGFPRAGAEDRDFCDRWRVSGYQMVWRPDARIEHRHAQSLLKFLDLHFRYGRGAYLYQAKRRSRGSGNMAADLGFHSSLISRVLRHFKDSRKPVQNIQLAGALLLWQLANAAGFFIQAFLSFWK